MVEGQVKPETLRAFQLSGDLRSTRHHVRLAQSGLAYSRLKHRAFHLHSHLIVHSIAHSLQQTFGLLGIVLDIVQNLIVQFLHRGGRSRNR